MTKEVKASVKSLRITPRKVGVVASLVRGRSVEDALTILEHTPRRAALPLSKLIESARANAENNHNMKTDTLVVEKLDVGYSQRGKRYRPAAHGRALPYQLKYSKISVTLTGEEKAKKADKKKADSKAAEAKKTDTKSEAKTVKTDKSEKGSK